MKLLFDQNLSRRLVQMLADVYPSATHVAFLGFDRASDTEIWTHATNERLAIVTKDSDFLHRSLLRGHPPKVVWIALGNCSTDAVATVLRDGRASIDAFVADDSASLLILE